MLTQSIPRVQRIIGTSISVSCLAGAILWVSLLLYAAQIVRAAPPETTYAVTAGPLLLHTLSRQITNGGYTITFTFEPGLLVFGLGWIAVGLLVGLAVYRARRPMPPEGH